MTKKQRAVLLVEDNNELRTMYKEVFEHNNFTVYESEDGYNAIDAAIINKPDAIILDLMLPKQGGIGALRVFRSLPVTKNTPIIILTALPNLEYKHEAEGRVQGYYLKTDIRPKELVKKVRELLD